MDEENDGVSDAIRKFILREIDLEKDEAVHQHAPLPPQSAPKPEPEPKPDELAPYATKKAKKKSDFIRFIFNDNKIDLPEEAALPSTVASIFGLTVNEMKVTKGDVIYNIDVNDDDFVPPVKIGRTYTVTKNKPTKQSTPIPVPRHPKQGNQCTIVLNDQRKTVSSGVVRKSNIVKELNLGPQHDIRLIGYDGKVLSANQFTLNPGATYYAKLNYQMPLKKMAEKIESAEAFTKPLAYMPPFMAALERIFFALSFTGDAITFAEDKEKKRKLHCTKTLSTSAYQVAFRFNNALDEIIKFTTKQNEFRNLLLNFVPNFKPLNDDDSSDDENEFEDPQKTRMFFSIVTDIIKLLEKAHEELEDLCELVVDKMKADNPSINSVKNALKVEINQENRVLEKQKRQNMEPENLQEFCNVISKDDNELLPKSNDLYDISINRETLNHVTDLLEKVLTEIEENGVHEDIINLLDFCAKISLCNLMHWIFALKLWRHVVDESQSTDTIKTTESYRNKWQVASKLCLALDVWDTVSKGEPLAGDMNKDGEDVQEIWNKLKEEITNSQYALEICYDDQNIGNI